MTDRAGVDESRAAELKRLGGVVHDLCQPLTAMQCRLEMAQMIDTDQDYREAVAIALKECERLSESVVEMRAVLRRLGTLEGVGVKAGPVGPQ